MSMTYRSMLNFLNTLSEEELDMNVSVVYDEEFLPISSVGRNGDGLEEEYCELDVGHPILIAN